MASEAAAPNYAVGHTVFHRMDAAQYVPMKLSLRLLWIYPMQATLEKASIDEVYVDVTTLVEKELMVRKTEYHFYK